MASILVIILVTIFVPFFVVGVLGNIGVLLSVLITPSLRTRANAPIVSLTSSCLAFLFLVVPFTLDSFINASWRFALWYCYATSYLTFAFIGITVFNIAVLSLYRYFYVVHPMKMYLRSCTNLAVMISVAWVIPLGTQTLIGTCGIARTQYRPEYGRCVLAKSGEHSTLYNLLVLGGFLPSLGLTMYSYAGIYWRVRGSARRLRRQGESSNLGTLPANLQSNPEPPAEAPSHEPSLAGEATGHKKKRSLRVQLSRNRVHDSSSNVTALARRGKNRGQNYLTKICVVVFILFMICYGPIVTLTIVYANEDFPPSAYMICSVIYWLGSCLHPLVYATLQPQMRRFFLRMLRCGRSPRGSLGESSVQAVTSAVQE